MVSSCIRAFPVAQIRPNSHKIVSSCIRAFLFAQIRPDLHKIVSSSLRAFPVAKICPNSHKIIFRALPMWFSKNWDFTKIGISRIFMDFRALFGGFQVPTEAQFLREIPILGKTTWEGLRLNKEGFFISWQQGCMYKVKDAWSNSNEVQGEIIAKKGRNFFLPSIDTEILQFLLFYTFFFFLGDFFLPLELFWVAT